MNILITDPYHYDSLTIFDNKFTLNRSSSKEEFKQLLPSAHALLIRSKTIIDKEVISCAKNLKFIATATSGLDHIDLQLCEQNNIDVFNPKEVNSISAAEHSFALLLSISKNLGSAKESLYSNKWKFNLERGSDLYGKTIGIIGLGRVGSKVAKMASAFNMKVQAYDPYKDQNYFESLKVEKVTEFNSLISSSDVISVHTPLTHETKHLLNKANLQLAQKHTVLINTSRGSCINETDLIQALKNGNLKAAALDVFENEPIAKDSGIIKLNNVLLSPHIGAYTEEAYKNASFECTQWLCDRLISKII